MRQSAVDALRSCAHGHPFMAVRGFEGECSISSPPRRFCLSGFATRLGACVTGPPVRREGRRCLRSSNDATELSTALPCSAPRKRTRVLEHQQLGNAHSPAVARTLTTSGQWVLAPTSCSNPVWVKRKPTKEVKALLTEFWVQKSMRHRWKDSDLAMRCALEPLGLQAEVAAELRP